MTPQNIGAWIGRVHEERVCDVCETPFRPRTHSQKRCSRQCSRLADLAAVDRAHAGYVRGGIKLDPALRDQAGD